MIFDAVRNNKRVSQIILAIIVVPFAFFGIESYLSSTPQGGATVATMKGGKITQVMFENALREEQQQIAQRMGGRFDSQLLNSPEFRRGVLDRQINEQLLALQASNERLSVSSNQIRQRVANLPVFQENGQFSMTRYQTVLANQRMSPAMFEAMMAQDVRTNQLISVFNSTILNQQALKLLLGAQLETRTVQQQIITPQDFLAKVTLADNAAHDYFTANSASFQSQPRVMAEYVVLEQKELAKKITVSDTDIEKYYQANQNLYQHQEERRARHILLELAKDAPEDQVKTVEARATELAAELQKNPSQFADLAQKYSTDKSSATKGGDLGFFRRTDMVKPFADQAFSLDKGKVSDPVRTDFGFHIIEVTDIRPEGVTPLAEVHGQIEDTLRNQQAEHEFSRLSAEFADEVYTQTDTLDSAADKFGLTMHTTRNWVTAADPALDDFHSTELVEKLFAPESLEDRFNTSATLVSPGVVISARITEYEPARQQEFDEVKDRITEQLTFQEAIKLAQQAGRTLLDELNAGNNPEVNWKEAETLTRADTARLGAATEAVFSLPYDQTLPAYVGAETPTGSYILARISEIKRADIADDDPRLEDMKGELRFAYGQLDLNTYLKLLRNNYGVQVRDTAILDNTDDSLPD